MVHAPQRRMRLPLLAAALGLVFAACTSTGPTPYDDDFGITPGNINAGAPGNGTLPDDNKADAQYPEKFAIGDQSPVKSQGSRGVCSIFASTALIENLYIHAGMPVAEADFSEQYLQWAVKNQSHSFPDSEGSSAGDNLQTVVTYGTVKESVWPYEQYGWSTANDPACTGGEEGLPTRCFTNGEPPASAAAAEKFKLPSQRWINTNSIKAQLTTKNVGVNIGVTFFYQAWDHRLSTIPIDDDLWRQGVVTYPNDKDKEESAKQPAGHAVQIVGWDDTKEVEMRDGDGKPVLGPDNKPMKEKGFYIFKNSWGTTSFGVEHPTGPGYGWISMKYVEEYASATTAEIPSLMATPEVCDDGVGADEDGDGQANCADADCTMSPACQQQPDAPHSYSLTVGTAIPDNDPAGLSSTIEIGDSGTITDAKLTVDITHSWRGDLVVTLTKGDDVVTISDHAGSSDDDLEGTFPLPTLNGKPLTGTWTLKVVDTAHLDTGTLNSWKLDVTSH
jgi:hypothetical protein